MKIADYVQTNLREVLRAATRRRMLSYAPFVILAIIALAFWSFIPLWAMNIIIAADLIAFIVVANHWAQKASPAKLR